MVFKIRDVSSKIGLKLGARIILPPTLSKQPASKDPPCQEQGYNAAGTALATN